MTEGTRRGISLEVLGSDLYGLAQTLATVTHGTVSIEDDRSRVLAYSASDETADELRRLSILGRAGPPVYLAQLRERGVFDRVRRSREVVEVPADPQLGIRRRLVVAISGAAPGAELGTIWVQEGGEPLAADSADVLRGAAAVGARMIIRTLNAPTAEAAQIDRLLGGSGGGVDVPSLASALGIATTGPAVVIGFADVQNSTITDLDRLVATMRLHASAYDRESLISGSNGRIYLLIPRSRSISGVTRWTESVIKRTEKHSGTALRAAIAAPVANLTDVPGARAEVDRVLSQTTGDQLVASLADSRTPVLLGEIMELIAGHDQLRDPRLADLIDYDDTHATPLRLSVTTYLRHFGDVRTAAGELAVHPNTLRYRIRRAEDILNIDLKEPTGRLLVEIQLALFDRGQAAMPRPVG